MKSPNELSFLPDDYLERKAQRRTNAICATLFLIVMTAIGSAFTYTEKAMRQAEQQHDAIEKHYTDAAKRIEQFQQLQEKQRTMAMQAELTSSLLEKVPRSFLLAEITNGMPDGVSLLDLNLEARVIANAGPAAPKTAFEIRKAEIEGGTGKPAAQPRVYDVSMRATGIAQNDVLVAQFIRKLNKSTLLKDVNLMFTDEFEPGQKDGPKLRKFQLELKLNPEAKIDAEMIQKQQQIK